MDMKEQETYNDEISLVDLAKVIVRRKKTIYLVFTLSVLIGLAAAFLLPKTYSYTTTIEIGQSIDNGRVRLIDEPQTLLVKINKTYIPLAQQAYFEQDTDAKDILNIKSDVPKKSQIIVITGKGTEDQQDMFESIGKDIVSKIKDDHGRLLKVLKKRYESQLLSIDNQIQSVEQQINIFKQNIKRLDQKAMLIRSQIKGINKELKQSLKNRNNANLNVRNEANAMTLLMIDTEMQNNRNRLFDLQQKLEVDMDNQKDILNKKISDSIRKVAEQKDASLLKKIELENLRETRALSVAMKSVEPIGMRKRVLVLLSLFAGLFLGVIAVFLHELFSNVKSELNLEK